MYKLNKFSERLNELMFDNSLSASELGEKIGHNPDDINRWKSDNLKYMPYLKIVLKLSDYFNCSIDFLLGLDEQNYFKTIKPRFFGKTADCIK